MTGLLRRRIKAFFLVSLMVGLVAAVACSGGDAGEQGPQGLKGDTGATGAQGLPGQDGQDGQDGEDGEDGAPGVDGVNGSNAAVIIHDSANNVAGAVEFRVGGTSMVILGGGFEAGESVSLSAMPRTVDILLGSATANDSGAFMTTINLPTSFEVDEGSVFTVTADGETTGAVYGVFVLVDKVPGN